MSTREALMQKLEKQPDWVLKEVSRYVDTLALKAIRADAPKPAPGSGWPPGYFEETWGAFADEPFERPPQIE